MSSEKNLINRRRFLKIALLSSGAATMAACNPNPSSTSVPAQPPVEPTKAVKEAPTAIATAPQKEVVELLLTGWPGQGEALTDNINRFNKENPGIKVTFAEYDPYREKLLALIAAGTPPDLPFIESVVYRTYAKQGLLLDITDMVKVDPVIGAPNYFIQPQETDRSTLDGKWYGIGSCWVSPHMFYNADALKEAGIEPPSPDPDLAWDWDTFLANAKKLTIDENGKHPDETGFDINKVKQWGILWPTWWIPIHQAVTSNGGMWADPKTGKLTLDQPEATQAMQMIADLMLVHKVMPQATFLEALGMSNTQMLENRRLAMAIDGSWALSWMYNMKAPLGCAPAPKIKVPSTDMQAHHHCIAKATKHPDEAWKLLTFLSSPDYQLASLKSGLWLPSQTSMATPEGLKKWMTPGVHPAGYEMMVTKYLPKYGHVAYFGPEYAEAESKLTPGFDAIWIGQKTAQQAMDEVVPEANKILGG